LEQAPHEVNLIQQSIRQRRPVPDVIANAPELLPGLQLYWTAWMNLMTCRRAPSALISWADIQHWADIHDLDSLQTADLHFHIRSMDLAFLTWKSDKDRRDNPPKQE
jgi:hypothetical protein